MNGKIMQPQVFVQRQDFGKWENEGPVDFAHWRACLFRGNTSSPRPLASSALLHGLSSPEPQQRQTRQGAIPESGLGVLGK